MKKHTLTTYFVAINLLMFLWMPHGLVKAQEPLNHPSKFYKSPDGKLFVNRNQPMYLFLGTSPEPGGQIQKLESTSTPKYANPFYFDSDGLNTIRTPWCVDTVTKQVALPLADIIFDVYADGTPPVTKASFGNTNKYVKNNTTYFGKGLTITLQAHDNLCGIEQILYSINNKPYVRYKDALDFNEEGTYQLSFYSVDNVGNIESVVTYNFHVDITPPVGTWTLEGDVHENMASASSKILLIANDALAGIKEIRYQINNQTVRIYKDGIELNELPTNGYELRYWVEDYVGNIFEGADGKASVHAFFVDRTPPKAAAMIIGDQFQNQHLFISPRSSCKLYGEDDLSGLNNIIYGFDPKIQDEIYENPFYFKDKNGLQAVYFQALDMVSNKSVLEKLTVYVDNEAPITRINYEGPQFFARDTLFINKETKIKLQSEDKESGVETIQYRINSMPMVKGSSFQLSDNGFHVIGFNAFDKVNNLEQEKQSEVFVDNEAPEIYVNFSIKAIREDSTGEEKISVYPPYVKMYIGATDRHCGTQDIYYSINNGKKIKYTGANSPADSEQFKDERLYEVNIEATDKLGNKSSRTLKFRVDKK